MLHFVGSPVFLKFKSVHLLYLKDWHYVSSAQILSRLCVMCGSWPTDMGHTRKNQGFAVASFVINEELHWRALRVLADGPLKMAVICKVFYGNLEIIR